MEKLKIIQISSASHSFAMKDYEEDMFRSWYARVAFQLKKFYPKIEVKCWTPERKYKKQKIKEKEGIKFRVFPTNFSLRHGIEISFPMIRALKKEIRKQKEAKKDKKLILHFHEYHSLLVYLILLFLKKENIKIVAQHHGARSPFANLSKRKKLFLFFPMLVLMQFFENILLRKIDIFYALSDEEIAYLKRKTRKKGKIKFQTMGIDKEYFKKGNKNDAKRLLKLDKNKKYIIYIGRIKKNKGITELLDVVKKLDVELLIIGDGPDLDKYKSYIENNKIENIKFLGLIYGAEKLNYLDACDCLILPSYTEGAPVVLMEAIAKNLPIIATNVGGIPKMIKNGREGIIIKPKSGGEIVRAIKKILTWKKKNIKKYANKYKWKKIIKETVKDYGIL